jgi:hypothetical protein
LKGPSSHLPEHDLGGDGTENAEHIPSGNPATQAAVDPGHDDAGKQRADTEIVQAVASNWMRALWI